MPAETAQWSCITREKVLRTVCNTIGDEEHYINTCPKIERSNIDVIPKLNELQDFSKLSILMEQMLAYD